jgi:hypothetical protein
MAELRAIETGEVEPLARARPDLPAPVVHAVERMLARERDVRFTDADDALRALAPWSAGELGSLRLASILDRVCPPNTRGSAIEREGAS